jgi:hypothetical protein
MADHAGAELELEAATLVAALQSGDIEAAKAAAEAVAQAEESLTPPLLSAGVVPALLHLLTPAALSERLNTPVTPVLDALTTILQDDGVPEALRAAGGVPLLLIFLQHQPLSDDVAVKAAKLLTDVHNGLLKADNFSHDVVAHVCTMLHTAGAAVVREFSSVLQDFALDNAILARMLQDANCVRALTELLLRLRAAHAFAECAAVLDLFQSCYLVLTTMRRSRFMTQACSRPPYRYCWQSHAARRAIVMREPLPAKHRLASFMRCIVRKLSRAYATCSSPSLARWLARC